MIAIIDYGVGNLFSLKSSFSMIGETAEVTADRRVIDRADHVLLPGVGAFGDARKRLAETGMDEVVCFEAKRGKPILGICLGMQLLFEKSYEFGEHDGLGLIPGEIVDMTPRLPAGLKVPHIGWNSLERTCPHHPLLADVSEGACVYFVHSFFADKCAPHVIATTDYGIPLTAAAARDNVMGCQFHPEKSGSEGLKILRAFCAVKG